MTGRVEVISGGMFAGKTEELIRRLVRCVHGRQQVILFKPSCDDRYHPVNVVSHAGVSFTARVVSDTSDIQTHFFGSGTVVGFDEAQFFDEGLIRVVNDLVSRGCRVIVAGLDLDSMGRAWPTMMPLMALADDVIKVHAVCTVCGDDASRSQRMVKDESQVLVGGTAQYEARCLTHWSPS